eukprot:Lithocolla_globosa_v1_NODE_523_length_3811_cov_20.780618.p3 type:complete len:106 gc:universal NODE_523_length_3811_cov_20.780618:3207-3524(+)
MTQLTRPRHSSQETHDKFAILGLSRTGFTRNNDRLGLFGRTQVSIGPVSESVDMRRQATNRLVEVPLDFLLTVKPGNLLVRIHGDENVSSVGVNFFVLVTSADVF